MNELGKLNNLLHVPVGQLENSVVLPDGTVAEKSTGQKKQDAKKLGYVKIAGVVNVSYSRLSVLHSCPRKFYLREIVNKDVTFSGTVHTAFGSAVGAGIQEVLRTGDLQRSLLFAMAHWDVDFGEKDTKSNKNIWTALRAVELFYTHYYHKLKDAGYELAYFRGKPGIELFYLVWFGEKYNHQGHIDVVLYHKGRKEFVVLELKTTSRASHPADWQNSDQTTGYSVILDAIAEEYGIKAAWKVEYLIYNPSRTLSNAENNWGFTNFTFTKSSNTKSDYLMSTLLDIKLIEMYFENQFFPKHGNNCRAWNRVCDYFGRCDELHDANIAHDLKDLHESNHSEEIYESQGTELLDFHSTFDTLISSQESRSQELEVVSDLAITDAVRGVLDDET